MIRKIRRAYISAYVGLPREIWLLSGALFINRFGTMVLPFLALYLTEEMNYSESSAGRLISVYGLGAIIGTFLGGTLTAPVGAIRLQIILLLLSIPVFLVIPFCSTWTGIAAALIVLSIFSEGVRPANGTAIAQFSPPDQQTRAFALQRMALNLGVSFGPAIGGFLATISFFWLFVADAFTTFLCAMCLLFFWGFKRAIAPRLQSAAVDEPTEIDQEPVDVKDLATPMSDPLYLAFLSLVLLGSVVFFQFYTTYPMYLRDVYGLTKPQTGLLFGINTILIVVLEMILVDYARRWPLVKTIGWGTALTCIGFGMLPFSTAIWYLILSVLVFTVGEMLAMPLCSGWVAQRSVGKNQGAYMGWYSTTYSVAFVLGPVLGSLVYEYDRDLIWYISLGVAGAVLFGFYILSNRLEAESAAAESDNS